ncbi:putative eukaryotic translation initiation factor eIF-1A subunit [Phakopsora pachyrhizi]|uniref:Eukaryotic translation initiation factor eIF-1A subunit n=1 Tax=Phakopsora pachyrhizi TaxID=170000 RepID=A0AAV0AWG5_PHAPC|nr:putative eukaryotic translation initiation factor eIF-1A subunit [Phakopsora pachyrhizi]
MRTNQRRESWFLKKMDKVIKMLGNGRLEAMCFDGEKRDFQDDKADVIQKYTTDEARNLKAYGELPENAKINETDTFGPVKMTSATLSLKSLRQISNELQLMVSE